MLAKRPQLNLVIGNTPIQQVNMIKLLGLTIVDSLSWSVHFDNIVGPRSNVLKNTIINFIME